MNTSGEAADQVVRMALQTGEVALKITGAGAKQLAVLIYAILKQQKKSKARTSSPDSSVLRFLQQQESLVLQAVQVLRV